MEMERIQVDGYITDVSYVNVPKGYILSLGDEIRSVDALPSTIHSLIVMIPGNPGLIAFYTAYLTRLADILGENWGIIGCSHASHVQHARHSFGLQSLEDQCRHKATFLSRLPSIPTVLIGHSVGAYIALRIRSLYPRLPITYVLSLFPTVRNLYEGLVPAVRLMTQPIIRTLVSKVIGCIPTSLFQLLLLVRGYLGFDSPYSRETKQLILHHLLNPYCLENVFYMAYCESFEIVDLDHALLRSPHELHFVYGQTDQYTPMAFYEEMVSLVGESQVSLAPREVGHAFCLQHSNVVAEYSAELIKTHCQSTHP